MIILNQSSGIVSVLIILFNKVTNILEVICPPALISSEVIPSAPGTFLFFNCFMAMFIFHSLLVGTLHLEMTSDQYIYII